MTYRQFLNECDNYDFTLTVLCRVAELERKHCSEDLHPEAMRDAIEHDFTKWLDKEVD